MCLDLTETGLYVKQNIIKKIIEITILICLINCITLGHLLWASSAHITTANSSAQQTIAALQIIEPTIILDRQMVKSIKLVAFDDKYGRVDLTLTAEASKRLDSVGKLQQNQKLIFTFNNKISDAIMVQKEINKNYYVISISTSRINADLIMKFFS